MCLTSVTIQTSPWKRVSAGAGAVARGLQPQHEQQLEHHEAGGDLTVEYHLSDTVADVVVVFRQPVTLKFSCPACTRFRELLASLPGPI